MELRRLIYLQRAELPNRRSNSLQTMRTCCAIAAQGVPVDLVLLGEEPVARDAIFEYYGLECPKTLTLRALGPAEWERVRFLRRMWEYARRDGRGVVFYTRAFRIARRLIHLRPLLRRPVVVESHMFDGFFEAQYLPQWVADVSAGRTPDPRSTESFRVVDTCYRRADGVVSLLGGTHDLLRREYPDTPSLLAWHGTTPDAAPAYEPEGRHGIYYIGNLYGFLQPETLFRALALLPGQELFVVGGNDERDLARARAVAESAGVAARVHFLGHVPPSQLAGYFERCRVVVSLFAGQKTAEYLSHALPMVIPDLPIARDVLRDGETCLVYRMGSAESLAAALRRLLEEPSLARSLARRAHQEALQHIWARRAERIVEFARGLAARGPRGWLSGRRLWPLS